jgi:hypothetical protein
MLQAITQPHSKLKLLQELLLLLDVANVGNLPEAVWGVSEHCDHTIELFPVA